MILIYLARQGRLEWLRHITPQPVLVGRRCAAEVQYYTTPEGGRVPLDCSGLEGQGLLSIVELADSELLAYVEIVNAAPKLGDETEGLAMAQSRGWRFVTTDGAALRFAREFMPTTEVLHLSELLVEIQGDGLLSGDEVERFLAGAMPGARRP